MNVVDEIGEAGLRKRGRRHAAITAHDNTTRWNMIMI
jgi:hypothetical protein